MRAFNALLSFALLAAPVAAGDAVVDFESGAEGWSGPFFVEPAVGNGGGAGIRAFVQSTGIHATNNTHAEFLGDYTQADEVTLSMDIKVDLISFFGSPVSRPWLVELRDYDSALPGYPWASVWFLFDNISVADNGNWETYSVTITDPDSTTLPAGWAGYGDEHPTTFEPLLPPGVTFADILSGVDEVSFTTFQPGFFFGFTDFDVAMDNVSISCTSDPWTDVGGGTVGANGPDTLVGTGSLVGGTTAGLDLSGVPANALTLAWLSFSSAPVNALGGTVHATPFSSQFLFNASALGELSVSTTWPVGIPAGTEAWFQFLAVDPAVIWGITLSNGLKITTP